PKSAPSGSSRHWQHRQASSRRQAPPRCGSVMSAWIILPFLNTPSQRHGAGGLATQKPRMEGSATRIADHLVNFETCLLAIHKYGRLFMSRFGASNRLLTAAPSSTSMPVDAIP